LKVEKKIILFSSIIVLFIVSCSGLISAQMNQINNSQKQLIKNNSDYGWIYGDVGGLIFDIRAYVICHGVDNGFHQEYWECTIPMESGFDFYVPYPEDVDHYTITAMHDDYYTKVVDVYLTPDDNWQGVYIRLIPKIKSYSIDPESLFLKFSELFSK
jgi:hypothetical protein